MIEFYEDLSFECLPRLFSEGVRVDFAFIDGQHTFDYALVDFFLVDKLLNVGGVVVLDDFGFASVQKVCRYISSNLEYVCIGPKDGVAPAMKTRIASSLGRIFPFSRLFRPELTIPNSGMNLPSRSRYVAFRKMSEDKIGPDPDCNRDHFTHHPF